MEEELEPRWLDGDEQLSWYALALLLNQLPAALDAQMQRDAGISQFEYMVLSALSMAPERTMRMSVLAEYAGATLSRLSNVVSRLVLDPLTKAQQRQLGVVASCILRAVDPDRGTSENS